MKNNLVNQIRENGLQGIDNYLNWLRLKWLLIGMGLMGLICLAIKIHG